MEHSYYDTSKATGRHQINIQHFRPLATGAVNGFMEQHIPRCTYLSERTNACCDSDNHFGKGMERTYHSCALSAAVAAINNQTSMLEESAHLLHCLAFLTAHNNASFTLNICLANITHLQLHCPKKTPEPFIPYTHRLGKFTYIPLLGQLIRFLLTEQLDWTSFCWTELSMATLCCA